MSDLNQNISEVANVETINNTTSLDELSNYIKTFSVKSRNADNTEKVTFKLSESPEEILESIQSTLNKLPEFYQNPENFSQEILESENYSLVFKFLRASIASLLDSSFIEMNPSFNILQGLIHHELNHMVNDIEKHLSFMSMTFKPEKYQFHLNELGKEIENTEYFFNNVFIEAFGEDNYMVNAHSIENTINLKGCELIITTDDDENIMVNFEEFLMIRTLIYNAIFESAGRISDTNGEAKPAKIKVRIYNDIFKGGEAKFIEIIDNLGENIDGENHNIWPKNLVKAVLDGMVTAIDLVPKGELPFPGNEQGSKMVAYRVHQLGGMVELLNDTGENEKTFRIILPAA